MTNMGTKRKHCEVEIAGDDQFHLNRRQRTEGSDRENQVSGHIALAEVYNYRSNLVPEEEDLPINLYNVGDTAVVSSDVTDDSLQSHYSEGNIGVKIQGIAQDGCSRTSSRDGVLIENWKAQELQSLTEHGKLDQFYEKNDHMEVGNQSSAKCKENGGGTSTPETNVSVRIEGIHMPNNKHINFSRNASTECTFKQASSAARTPVKEKRFTEVPTSTKMLISTGLLEGAKVHYLSQGGNMRLNGRIRGIVIECLCRICEGKKQFTISNFEKHAGSGAKRPSDFIFFENGTSLRDLVDICRSTTEHNFQDAIRETIQSTSSKNLYECKKCGEHISLSRGVRSHQTCTKCESDRSVQENPEAESITNASVLTSSKCGEPAGGFNLVKRGRGRPPKGTGSKAPEKPLRETKLHKLLFLPSGLKDGTPLAYYHKRQKFREGYKKHMGIFCECCEEVVSCSEFEAHAGWGHRRSPYQNIFLSDGRSLHEVALALSKQRRPGRKKLTDPSGNDDYCWKCGDGGELLLCDECTKAYHTECLGMPGIPDDDNWFCPSCRPRDSPTGRNDSGRYKQMQGIKVRSAATKGRPSRLCEREVKAAVDINGACILCECKEFTPDKLGFNDETVIFCDQCNNEFHVGCLRKHKSIDLKEVPQGLWFCSDDCSEIHNTLKNWINNGAENLPPHLCEIIRKRVKNCEKETVEGEIKWQILHGETRDPAKKALLSESASIFHELFTPIKDPSTGRDLIPLMLNSQSMRDQDFARMYSAVLTVNSEVVSAAVFRVFGRTIAELPLVATREKFQGQGYFQSLYLCIEELLVSLRIHHLVLPAAEDTTSLWTNKMGFTKISRDKSLELSKGSQIMFFKGTSMLEKPLVTDNNIHGPSINADKEKIEEKIGLVTDNNIHGPSINADKEKIGEALDPLILSDNALHETFMF